MRSLIRSSICSLPFSFAPIPKPSFIPSTLPTLRIGFCRIPLVGRWIALWKLRNILPLFFLRRHTLVVAKSGSGKSELLKLVVLLLKSPLFPWLSITHISMAHSPTENLFPGHGDEQNLARE